MFLLRPPGLIAPVGLLAFLFTLACTAQPGVPATPSLVEPIIGLPTAQPTPLGEDWPIYQAADFGFELRFPSNYYVQRSTPPGVFLFVPYDRASDTPADGDMRLVVRDGTMAQFFEQIHPDAGKPNRELYQRVGQLTLPNGLIALVTYGGCCGEVGKYVFVGTGKRLYVFSLLGPAAPPGQMRNEPLFEAILQRFRLVGD